MMSPYKYCDKTSSLETFLEMDRSVPLHIRKLQILATETHKVNRDLVPTKSSELFKKQYI